MSSHAFFFAPHLVTLFLLLLAVPAAIVGRASIAAVPGGLNSLTTYQP